MAAALGIDTDELAALDRARSAEHGCEMDDCRLQATVTLSPGPDFVPLPTPAPAPRTWHLCISHAIEILQTARAASSRAN